MDTCLKWIPASQEAAERGRCGLPWAQWGTQRAQLVAVNQLCSTGGMGQRNLAAVTDPTVESGSSEDPLSKTLQVRPCDRKGSSLECLTGDKISSLDTIGGIQSNKSSECKYLNNQSWNPEPEHEQPPEGWAQTLFSQ